MTAYQIIQGLMMNDHSDRHLEARAFARAYLAQPAAQPPPGPSVALRRGFQIARDYAVAQMVSVHGYGGGGEYPEINWIDADKHLAIEIAALATAPAEGVDGQDALREALKWAIADWERRQKTSARGNLVEQEPEAIRRFRAALVAPQPLPSAKPQEPNASTAAAVAPAGPAPTGSANSTARAKPQEEGEMAEEMREGLATLAANLNETAARVTEWLANLDARMSGGNRRAAENDAPSELASSVSPAVPDTGHYTRAANGELPTLTLNTLSPEGPPATAGHNPEGVEARALATGRKVIEFYASVGYRDGSLAQAWLDQHPAEGPPAAPHEGEM